MYIWYKWNYIHAHTNDKVEINMNWEWDWSASARLFMCLLRGVFIADGHKLTYHANGFYDLSSSSLSFICIFVAAASVVAIVCVCIYCWPTAFFRSSLSINAQLKSSYQIICLATKHKPNSQSINYSNIQFGSFFSLYAMKRIQTIMGDIIN